MKIKVKLSDKTKEELKGIQGVQGIKGDKGDRGSDGLNGKDGLKGDKGDEGKQGKEGKDGKNGLKGERGLRGFKGDTGNDGRAGTDGSPDTPAEVRDKLEILKGEDRLDAKAIKNLTTFVLGEGGRKIFTSKDADKQYLKLDCSNDPLTENLEIGTPTTDRKLTIFAADTPFPPLTGLMVADVDLGRGSWIQPNGQDGIAFDALGEPTTLDQMLWFQYYSSGDLNLCFGGGDIEANNANFTTNGAVIAGQVQTNNYQNLAGTESLIWSAGDDWWEFGNDLQVDGNITLSGTVDGVDVSTIPTTYLKLDCSNDPLTGNLEISKADPEYRLTDTGNSEYSRWIRSDTNNKMNFYNRTLGFGNYYSVTANAATDNISLPYNVANQIGTSDITISFFLKINTLGRASYILSTRPNDADNIGYDVLIGATNLLTCKIDNGATSKSVTATTAISDTNWHHILFLMDRDGTGKGYIDLTEVASADISASAGDLDSGTAFRIFDPLIAGDSIYADVSEVAVYNRLLSVGEQTTEYGAGAGYYHTGLESGLVVLFHFDEGTGTDTVEEITSANAALTSVTWSAGKVLPPSSMHETIPLTSTDGVLPNEYAIHTFGDVNSRNVCEGLTQRFNTAGVERMHISNAGLVGIGRTPTTNILDVHKSVGFWCVAQDDGMQFYDVANSNNQFMRFSLEQDGARIWGKDGTAAAFQITSRPLTHTYLNAQRGGSYLGIGMTAPGCLVHIDADGTATAVGSANSALEITGNTNNTTTCSFTVKNANAGSSAGAIFYLRANTAIGFFGAASSTNSLVPNVLNRVFFLANGGAGCVFGTRTNCTGDKDSYFVVDDVVQYVLKDGVIYPYTDNDIDLGDTTHEFKNLYIDGIIYADEIQLADNESIKLGTGLDATITFNGSGLVIQSDAITATDYLQLRGGTNGIDFNIGATEQISLIDGVLQPTTTNDIDLGTSSLLYKDIWETGKHYFRDSAIYAWSGSDGWMNLVADTGVEVNAPILNVSAIYSAGNVDAATFSVASVAGASGTFTTVDLKTVTVTNGIITSIV